MLTSAFIRHEIDAINEKWREIQKGSERKGEGLAIFYRLHIHPDLWRGIQEFLDTLSAEGREPFVFPEVEFLELTVNCDYAVEGWLILPIADLSPALRFNRFSCRLIVDDISRGHTTAKRLLRVTGRRTIINCRRRLSIEGLLSRK